MDKKTERAEMTLDEAMNETLAKSKTSDAAANTIHRLLAEYVPLQGASNSRTPFSGSDKVKV